MDAQTKVALLYDGALWVGGNFTKAGAKDIAYVAKWTKPGRNTVTFDRLRARRGDNGVRIEWEFTAYRPWVSARLERAAPGGPAEVIARADGSSSGEFLDEGAAADRAYDYTLVVERDNGTEAHSAPVRVEAVPPSLWLGQNQPNPFNPSTTIRYRVPAASRVTLRIHDVAGRLVRTLSDQNRPAGEYDVTWDGRDDRGAAVAAGVYFYRLAAGGESLTRKTILLK